MHSRPAGGLGRGGHLAVTALLLVACRDDVVHVRLAGPVVEAAPAPSPAERPLDLAISSDFSPDRSTITNQRFARYLGQRLGAPVAIARRRTNAELNELLRNGTAAAGILCPGAYAVGREQFGLRAVAVPLVNDRGVYRAYVIARVGAGKRSLDDLRGSTFAFSDPLSQAGYRWVLGALVARQATPEQFFASTIFTFGHDNTIDAVEGGLVDAGVVSSRIWDEVRRQSPAVSLRVEVIQRSEPFAGNPVVVSPAAAAGLDTRLAAALLAMTGDAEGRAILGELGLSGFGRPDEAAYDALAAAWRAEGGLSAKAAP